MTEEQMRTAFGGYFAAYEQRTSVPFPGEAEFAVSVPEGSNNLYDAIYAHLDTKGTPLTIGGVSKGAPSVVDVLYRLMEDAQNTEDGITPPSADDMNVAIYGAPGRTFFIGTKYQPVPETPYDILIVSAEYDGIADFPDNPFNILALMNAARGAELLHVDAAFYDVAHNPVYYRVDENSLGGTTTTVVVPASRLPLLHDMYESDVWDPNFTAALEKMLRPIIDSAYKRNWASQRKYWTFDIPATLPGAPGPAAETFSAGAAPELATDDRDGEGGRQFPGRTTAGAPDHETAPDDDVVDEASRDVGGAAEDITDDAAHDGATLDDAALGEAALEEAALKDDAPEGDAAAGLGNDADAAQSPGADVETPSEATSGEGAAADS
ncbi:PE-PPE domain-containing protein [Mycolicibacterium iranicum]|nr:PE-PPE domain-containing protein [Mycolicibacterium iranicum]